MTAGANQTKMGVLVQARTELTRRKIFEAAFELLGASGVDNTSVDDIVEKAGVSKATVYYHFTGKAELVEAMVRYRSRGLLDAFEDLAEKHADDPMAAIRGLVEAQLEFLTANASFSRLLTTEIWRSDRPWHAALVEVRNRLTNTFCRVVRHGVDMGIYRSDIDPDFAGYAIFGMTTYAALDRLSHEPDRPYDDLLDQITRLVEASLVKC